MNKNKIEKFITENSFKFKKENIEIIKEDLLNIDFEKFEKLNITNFKSPSSMLLISIILGPLGIDRFILGDYFKGIIKICILFFYWIIDVFLITNATKEKNFILFKRLTYK